MKNLSIPRSKIPLLEIKRSVESWNFLSSNLFDRFANLRWEKEKKEVFWKSVLAPNQPTDPRDRQKEYHFRVNSTSTLLDNKQNPRWDSMHLSLVHNQESFLSWQSFILMDKIGENHPSRLASTRNNRVEPPRAI